MLSDFGVKLGQQWSKTQVLPANSPNSSSMISGTTVVSFTTSNKPGTKWWLLTLIRQMLAASGTMQVSLWQPFLLVGPILSCTMASLITWLPHSSLWQTQLSVRPNHAKKTCPWTVFKGATWMSKRGTKSRTLMQLDQKFLLSHQGWLGLVICLWLQSQHATKVLWDPTKNFHKHVVNSPHKINIVIPRPTWFTMSLKTTRRVEFMTSRLCIPITHTHKAYSFTTILVGSN